MKKSKMLALDVMGAGDGLRYLLRDLFTTDRAAGAVNGTAAEPGPSLRVTTDTESKLTISGEKLVCAGSKAAAAWGDPAFAESQRIFRSPGRALLFTIRCSNGTSHALAGFYPATGNGSNMHNGIYYGVGGSTLSYRMNAAPFSIAIGAVAQDTDYRIAVVMRSSGAAVFIKGGAYSDWTLLWVDTQMVSFEYIVTSFYSFAGSISDVVLLDLPAPFDSDYGTAVDFKPALISAPTTFTHTADCLIEYTLTTRNSANAVTVDFRKQDVNNYWQVSIAADGALTLYEVISGTPNSRQTAAAGSIASGQRMVITASGQTIKVFANNALKMTHTTAANFATATAGALSSLGTGGAVSNIITYPLHYGAGITPAAGRAIVEAATVDVATYGAHHTGEAGYETYDNAAAFQAAIFAGRRVEISTAGTYLLSRRLFVPSNRTIIGMVNGVTLKKSVGYSHVFCNTKAASLDGSNRDSNITLDNLTIDDNNSFTGAVGDDAAPTLKGILSFRLLDGLTLNKITIINGNATQYAVQLNQVTNATATTYSYTGLKDGFHIEGGCHSITIDGFTIVAGDDTFAVLANGWPLSQSSADDITNIIIQNGTSNCGAAPGFFVRMITGSWLAWASGNTYNVGHICTNGGRIYKKANAGSAAASAAPTHAWGDITGADGITWRWIGNGSNLNNNIRGVYVHNVTLTDNRILYRMVEATADNNSEYPGTENTSILDELHTDLPASKFTNSAGLLGNTYFDEAG